MSLLQRIGVLLIVLSIILIGTIYYINSEISVKTQPFSSYTVLSSSWEKFKVLFVNRDGRVINYSQNAVTTSDAQAFALLRSVWIDDKTTFDAVWQWTRVNLQHHTDSLFGWEWGENIDGTYGFIKGGGEKNHTSADANIALALLLASARWKDPSYKEQAKPIIISIWQHDTVMIGKKRFVLPGSWANNGKSFIIQPYAFTPYAWRAFASLDSEHDWKGLIDQTYTFLHTISESPLNTKRSVGLPPESVLINSATGELQALESGEVTSAYKGSVLAVPWGVALDYFWSHDLEAKSYLDSSFTFLKTTYLTSQKLAGAYTHDGKILEEKEDPRMYATLLGYFLLSDPDLAKKLYEGKILRLYRNDENTFLQSLPPDEQSWLWLAAALYNHSLNPFGVITQKN